MLAQVAATTTIIAAALLLVCTVLPLVILDAGDSPIGWVRDGAWPYLSVMAFALAAVMPFVILAIYACQIEETGVLGLVGLTMSLIGMVAYLGFQFDMAFVWPVLAARAPELVDFSGPMFRDPRFAFIHFWMGPVYSVGVLLFGIALIKARVFPRTASVLFMLGVILSAGALFPPFLIRAVGGVLGAPAMAWMALILWRRAGQEFGQSR
jgi:hypothetical protein